MTDNINISQKIKYIVNSALTKKSTDELVSASKHSELKKSLSDLYEKLNEKRRSIIIARKEREKAEQEALEAAEKETMPNTACATRQCAGWDTDHDGIPNWFERLTGTNPDAANNNDLSNFANNGLLDASIESQFVNTQVMRDVQKMMNNLPAPQREVVYMRFYQEMSFKEIAETTGVSINTSLGRMRYAILNLRRMAKEYDIQLQLA